MKPWQLTLLAEDIKLELQYGKTMISLPCMTEWKQSPKSDRLIYFPRVLGLSCQLLSVIVHLKISINCSNRF